MNERKLYQLPAEGKMIEVTEEQYRDFYKYKRREKYLEEQDAEHNVYHYSDLDTDEILGEEMFSYPEEAGVEDQVVDVPYYRYGSKKLLKRHRFSSSGLLDEIFFVFL